MPISYQPLTPAECNTILAALDGLRIGRVWRGATPAVFLEVGRLAREERHLPSVGRRVSLKGRATFMIESDWRVEGPRSIQFGSGFGDRKIDSMLHSLKGQRIAQTAVEGPVPELRIALEDGRRIRTFTDWTTQPHWSIGFRDTTLIGLHERWRGMDVVPWIHVRAGRISIEYCYD